MDFGQCYCLRWNNYQSSVVSLMRSMLQDKAFLDVTIACDGRSIPAHRLMLASCSDFFNDILRENQSDHPIIFLRDVSYWEIEAIIDFIYNGQVNIMQDQLTGFIKTAEALQIKGLAAVNNNHASPSSTSSNNNNNNNNSLNNNNSSYFNNNNIKSEYQKNGSTTPIQDITKFNAYGPHTPTSVKYELNNSYSPPLPLSPTESVGTSLNLSKKRRYESPTPSDFTTLDSTTSDDTLSLKNSLGLNSSVANMTSLSVAKAISLSKLVHEISSQASIASLKSASLPTSEDLNRKEKEPNSPPLTQPLPQIPSAQFHNTKDWASNKNEDGFPACSLCGKVFKHQGSLVAHYQVHQQRTKCPVCQKVLSRHYHMKVHLLTVHKVPDSEIDGLLRAQCVN